MRKSRPASAIGVRSSCGPSADRCSSASIFERGTPASTSSRSDCDMLVEIVEVVEVGHRARRSMPA
jgi:hypothetical protein